MSDKPTVEEILAGGYPFYYGMLPEIPEPEPLTEEEQKLYDTITRANRAVNRVPGVNGLVLPAKTTK